LKDRVSLRGFLAQTIFLAFWTMALFGVVSAQEPRLETIESGSGSPLVIVLHGGPGVAHDYLLPEWKSVEAFASVLFYDQRGTGRNGDLPGPYGWKQHVSDLDAIIGTHAEGRPVILAGSSWGSMLALLHGLGGDRRVQGIILSGYPGWMGPDLVLPSDRHPRLLARIDSLEKGTLERPVSAPDTISSGLGIPGYEADSIVSERVKIGAVTENGRAVLNTLPKAPGFQALVGLEIPVLVISGDRGGRIPDGAAALEPVLPNLRRVIVRDAAHDPWAADPDAFFGEVRAFLAELGLIDSE